MHLSKALIDILAYPQLSHLNLLGRLSFHNTHADFRCLPSISKRHIALRIRETIMRLVPRKVPIIGILDLFELLSNFSFVFLLPALSLNVFNQRFAVV